MKNTFHMTKFHEKIPYLKGVLAQFSLNVLFIANETRHKIGKILLLNVIQSAIVKSFANRDNK